MAPIVRPSTLQRCDGPIAQRESASLHDEVVGSIPPGSTSLFAAFASYGSSTTPSLS